MAIITLTTDFGIQDGFVGVMKGIILGIAPEVQIVDLSHQIAPQNVLQGARLLRRHTRYFPAGRHPLGPLLGSPAAARAVTSIDQCPDAPCTNGSRQASSNQSEVPSVSYQRGSAPSTVVGSVLSQVSRSSEVAKPIRCTRPPSARLEPV